MSDSDESEQLGFLAEQSDDHESDVSDEPNDSHDEADSESGSEDASNDLFDLEAVDSDEGERSDRDESDAEHDGLAPDPWSEAYFFPQFKRLPLELRTRIWEFFCPDFAAKSRVYWFQIYEYHVYHNNGGLWELSIQEGPLLEQQTRDARTMLAVQHESRQLALKAFPDTLSFGANGILRFNSHKDIVFLRSERGTFQYMERVAPVPGFSEHIRHLAVEAQALSELLGRHSVLFDAFENLETAYYITSAADHGPQHLRWCTTDLAKRYYFETVEEQPGLGEEAQLMYCWPDVDKHSARVADKIPLDGMNDDLTENYTEIDAPKFNGVPIWPLVEFLWRYGLQRFDELAAWDGEGELNWGAFGDGDDDDDQGEPDEYESEGIDDSDISDDDDSQESEGGDLIVLDDDSDQDEEGSDSGSPDASGSPGPQGHGDTIDLTGDDDENIAEFSSPEQSSATLQGSEESPSESDQPAPRTSRLKRRRGRVVASDSEDNSDDDLPRKRARAENRGAPIILSSDDEEDEVRKMRANQRARAVVSEDDDEEEDEEDGDDGSGASRSEEEDDSEDSEGGAAVSKPMSLAQKLQLHRERNPIPASDDEDPDSEEMRGDDYDARDYADFQDDEEGNAVSDDGQDDEQELIMDDEDNAEEDDEY